MVGYKCSKIGKVYNGFGTFQLKSVLIKNDAGDWGSEPDENAVGIIRSTNFNNNGKLDLSDIAYRTLLPQKLEEKSLSPSDILIERSGGSDTQPVGRVGFISDEMAEDNLAFANFIQRISLDETVDAKFVYYCLQQMYEMGITASMQFQTTGIRNLDWKFYLKTNLPKPTKEQQTLIANLLSKVDEAIASVQNSIAAAERLKKSLMQNLLTGKMKPDGTFRTPEEFYIDNKFGKVPVGWEVKKVQELSIQVTDGEHQTPERTETGYYLLSARNIKNGYLSLDDVDYIPEKELRRIQKRCNPQVGDILISCSGTIGNVCIVPDGFIGGMVRSAALVKLNSDKIEPQFAELMFQSHYLQNQMKVAVASSVQGNIFQGAIKKLRLFYPHDKQERIAITERLCLFNKEIASMQDKLIVFDRLKKSLMQNLLTGKVIVRSK